MLLFLPLSTPVSPSTFRERCWGYRAGVTYFRFANRRSTATSKGVAKKIDEYVPTIIPIRSVSAKWLVEVGPKI